MVIFGRRITGIWASREISRETDSSSSLVNENVFNIGRLPTFRSSPRTIEALRYRSNITGISRYKRRKCEAFTLDRFAHETHMHNKAKDRRKQTFFLSFLSLTQSNGIGFFIPRRRRMIDDTSSMNSFFAEFTNRAIPLVERRFRSIAEDDVDQCSNTRWSPG